MGMHSRISTKTAWLAMDGMLTNRAKKGTIKQWKGAPQGCLYCPSGWSVTELHEALCTSASSDAMVSAASAAANCEEQRARMLRSRRALGAVMKRWARLHRQGGPVTVLSCSRGQLLFFGWYLVGTLGGNWVSSYQLFTNVGSCNSLHARAASQKCLLLAETSPEVVISCWVAAEDLPRHDASASSGTALGGVRGHLLACRPQSKRKRSCSSAHSLQPSAAHAGT